MANVGKAQLKSYFQTGSKPTQDNFEDLIDSLAQNTSDITALASASAGPAGLFVLSQDTPASISDYLGINVSSLGVLATASAGTVGLQLLATENTSEAFNLLGLTGVSGSDTMLVSDLTPQLGGDLDVNDFKITSANDGDVQISPDGDGNVVIGDTSAPSFIGSTAINTFFVGSSGYSGGNLGLFRWSSEDIGPTVNFFKARGQKTSAVAAASDDSIGNIIFHGYDGTQWIESAMIAATANASVGTSMVPTKITLWTKGTAGVLSEGFRLDENQRVALGTVPNTAYRLTVGATSNASDPKRGCIEAINTHVSATNFNIRNTNTGYKGDLVTLRVDSVDANQFNYLNCVAEVSADTTFRLNGSGNGYADGSWTGGGADYAEFFEWKDRNKFNHDRRGRSVVLDNGRIRVANLKDDPNSIIGIISEAPTVVAGANWNHWHGKYKKDKFGALIRDGEGKKIISEHFKDTKAYVPRTERKEWAMVGLVGRLLKVEEAPVNPRWIKLKSKGDGVEEWLVR